MTTTKKKPPTQTAGVSGIAPKPIELTPAQPARIDWTHLLSLPPFQMFVIEKQYASDAEVSLANGTHGPHREGAISSIIQRGGDDLHAEYYTWHEAKGYWPNETPTGELKTFEA